MNKDPIYKELADALSDFYAHIKNINTQLVRKANIDEKRERPYSSASFTDAMDLAITSNALSLIKAFMLGCYRSITTAFNIRNIIEHLSLVLMDEAGDITPEQKELFNEQYKLIEYNFYKDIDLGDNGDLLDKNELQKRFEDALCAFKSKGYSKGKARDFAYTRAPFLCQKNFNFNEIIEQYLPRFKDYYEYLSRYTHPSSISPFRTDENYQLIAHDVLCMLMERYSNYDIDSTLSLPFYKEQSVIYGNFSPKSIAFQLYNVQKRQSEILFELADIYKNEFGEDTYVSEIFRDLALIVYDINTDSQLGYTENPKLKFKVIAELFACLSKVLLDLKSGDTFYRLMCANELFWHFKKNNLEFPQEIQDQAYADYKVIYPDSTLSKEEFFEEFKLSNGYLINQEGKRLTLKRFVFDFLDSVIDSELKTEQGSNILNQYKILYLESQGMSHGCGYLYFANHGAWMEDINVIVFLDICLSNILKKESCTLISFTLIDKIDEKLIATLISNISEMNELIKEKARLIQQNPRILKFF